MGDSNPQSDEANLDEGWDDEPNSGGGTPEVAAKRPAPAPAAASAPRPDTSAPSAAPTVVNAWGPVPASRPPMSGPPLGTIGAPVVAPRPAALPRPVEARPIEPRPTALTRPIEPRPALAGAAPPAARTIDPALSPPPAAPRASAIGVLPKPATTPPNPKAKFGSAPKEARAAKVAKKTAKKAARQAERKARAKNNNKAAIRGVAAAAERRADPAPPSASARAVRRKTAFSSESETSRRADASEHGAKSSARSAVVPTRGARSVSTMLLILVAAVLVLAALGWFLAQRH